jgi:hypothetical protein
MLFGLVRPVSELFSGDHKKSTYLSRGQHPLEPHSPIAPRSDASSTLLVNSPKGAITALPLCPPWFLIGRQYLQAQVLAHAGFLL